jgi:hypothetical protein
MINIYYYTTQAYEIKKTTKKDIQNDLVNNSGIDNSQYDTIIIRPVI